MNEFNREPITEEEMEEVLREEWELQQMNEEEEDDLPPGYEYVQTGMYPWGEPIIKAKRWGIRP